MLYNLLSGNNKKWSKENGFRHYEATTRVKGGRHKAMSGDVGKVAGDGTYGFSFKRTGEDDVKMTEGIHGGFVKKRKSIAKKRKNTCLLWSPQELLESQLDDHVLEKILSEKLGRIQDTVKEQREAKRQTRKRNRNHKARRTQRRLKRAA